LAVRRAKFTGATSNTVGVFGTGYESKTVKYLVSQTVAEPALASALPPHGGSLAG
jgi:hypothetical protein